MIEIVIKLEEETYNRIMNGWMPLYKAANLMENVQKGTPLPKHHGDLIDRDTIEVLRIGNIQREYDKGFDAGVTCMVNRILDAPTIIERSDNE